MTGILAGLRIVEGSAFIAAPLGGMTLAQLGAEVIRFDDIKGGLDNDRWPITQDGRSIYWAGLNKGKRSIAVDLRSPRGRELLGALITAPGEGAGIFTTNMPARGWSLERALGALRLDHADVLLLGLWNKPVPERVMETARQVTERGLARFIGSGMRSRGISEPLTPPSTSTSSVP